MMLSDASKATPSGWTIRPPRSLESACQKRAVAPGAGGDGGRVGGGAVVAMPFGYPAIKSATRTPTYSMRWQARRRPT
ncbi:MAG: hypothetical protein M3320_08550 [Actinomycetota bacterium]|nr:hypothetical protein [Actinomycetota bacterium]